MYEVSGGVSVLSYTHLGYLKDQKSTETGHLSSGLESAGILDGLYVLDVSETLGTPIEKIHTPVPGSKLFPRILYLLNSLPSVDVEPRKRTISLVDIFAARNIVDTTVLLTLPHFQRTIRAQKRRGGTVSIYAAAAHPKTNQEILNKEKELLSLDNVTSAPIIENHGLDSADYVLTLSPFSRSSYLQNGFSKNEVFNVGPLGIDTSIYNFTPANKNEFVVAYVANTTILKGLHYLLDAWENFDHDNARLVICGKLPSQLVDLYKKRINADDRIEWRGFVDDPREVYNEASVLVMPSLTEGGPPKVVLEAMASGVPVIVTEHCDTNIVKRNSGFIVPIRKPEAINERLEQLAGNESLLRKMGMEARKIAELYNWENFEKRVANAHMKILNQENNGV